MSFFTPIRRSSAVLPCDAALVYEVLTDYDHCSEWLPHIAQSKSLATEGDLAIAEFEFLPFRRERFVVECIHTCNRLVLWRAIEGRVPITQVQWDIAAEAATRCRVSISVSGLISLNPLRPGAGKFFDPHACLQALRSQTSSFIPEIMIAGMNGERILDLTETEDGVVCWFRGRKFVLKQESSGER